MYRMSYWDLRWEPVSLEPLRYTIEDGVQTPLRAAAPSDQVCVRADGRSVVIGMPAGRGKVSDAGYDQMACLVAEFPVHDHVVFSASVRVLQYPDAREQNGQEGLGLFFRDTMELDPRNGYPYSNMAVAGVSHARRSLFGRQGITRDSIESVQAIARSGDSEFLLFDKGTRLDVSLELCDGRLVAQIAAEGEASHERFEAAVDKKAFSSRDPQAMALGFMAARGCQLEVDLDSVSIEYESQPDVPSPALFASPEGSPSARGTQDEPLDLQSAIDRCKRGQEVRVLPGRYQMSEDLVVSRSNSGSPCAFKRIRVENSFGEPAVLDFGGSDHGFCLEGDNWDVSGLTVTRGHGFKVSGNGNRIHHCLAVANLETGFLVRHPSSDAPKNEWPSGNTISDCISCLNKDPSEQNADGFACKVAAGADNAFVRCTAWMNSDDGFDLFSKNRAIGAVTLTECRSWLNGFTLLEGELVATRGNGNGFKLGGSGLAVDHEVVGCEAVGNREFGFTSNSSPCMRLTGCRAQDNKKNYMYYFTGTEPQGEFVTVDCTENDDPAFDAVAWAREHLPLGSLDSSLPSVDDACDLLQRDWAGKHNEAAIQNALKTARALRDEVGDDLPAVMVMCSSFYGGGAERVACRLATGLAQRFQVYFLYIQDKGQSYNLDPRVKTLLMPFFYGSWDVINACRADFCRRLKEVLDIQTAVSFMYTMNRVNAESLGGKTKVVCSERNNPMRRYLERMPEIDKLYAASDHVVFQSETVRDMFSEAVRAHASIIMNPVEVGCERVESRPRIVNVGRLVPQKNQAMLIRAFAAFHQSHPDHTLSFYGSGELIDELQALAGSLGVGEAVQFHGQVYDVHTAIADAEMFVLSSDFEGLSNALLECMMMGLPCISTRCEGSVNVIRSGENGILTDIGDEEQLVEAMTRLADDAELRRRLGDEARNSCESFRTEPVIEQWVRLIEELSAG